MGGPDELSSTTSWDSAISMRIWRRSAWAKVVSNKQHRRLQAVPQAAVVEVVGGATDQMSSTAAALQCTMLSGAMRLVGVPSVAFWTVLLTGLYPSGLRRVRWPMPISSPLPARCGDWRAYCLSTAASPGPPRCGFPPPRFPKKRPSPSRSRSPPSTCSRPFAPLRPPRVVRWREAAWLSSCVLPLAAWYAWHYAKTGFLFGNPEFLRYNAQANLSPLRFLAAFGHRILHLTAHMNLFVPVLMTIAALLLEPRPDPDGDDRASSAVPSCAASFCCFWSTPSCSACWAARC